MPRDAPEWNEKEALRASSEQCDDYAVGCMSEGQPTDALRWALRAFDIEPTPEREDYIGRIYFALDDLDNSYKWYKKGAAAGRCEARSKLITVLLRKAEALGSAESKLPLYLEASQLESVDADYWLGSYYESLGKNHETKAVEFLVRAAKAGHHRARQKAAQHLIKRSRPTKRKSSGGICPECNGAGCFTVGHGAWNVEGFGHEATTPVRRLCPRCEGAGSLEQDGI